MMQVNQHGRLIDYSEPAPGWVNGNSDTRIGTDDSVLMIRYKGDFLRNLTNAFDTAGRTWIIQRLEDGYCKPADVQICFTEDLTTKHVNNLYNLAQLQGRKIILMTYYGI